ncbi:MAG TPA: FtsX-like permease family protein [Thermoanaerobaculia bacterium]|nr:FtsX-like permease family protein [Thermoanaerobaculia bacterium]
MGIVHDLKLGLRALRAAPLTTAAAVLVIALGMGVNAAVLAVTYGILIRPLPYPEPSRLVILSVAAADGADFGVPLAEVDEWRRRLRTVESLAGYATSELRVQGAGEPRLVSAAHVTDGFFGVLGFGHDLRAGGAAVSERLGAKSGGLTIGASTCEIGAILPRMFSFPSEKVDVWIPAVPQPPGSPDYRKLRIVARMKPGVSRAQLKEDAVRVLRELHGPEMAKPGSSYPTVTPFEDAVIGDARPVLGASMAGAVLVLFVTCGNVGMLLLGRAVLRRRDSAVRLALGAGRWRLARGPLVESLLLALAGSLLGLGLAVLAVRIFLRVAAGMVPRSHAIAIDAPVLAASAAMIFFVTLLCGAAPALDAARKDFTAAFRGGLAGEPRTRRILSLLVVGQIAASIVLLSSAVLLARTVERLLAEDLGIEPEGVLVAKLSKGDGAVADAVERKVFAREVLDRVRALPGVTAAGLGSSLPPAGAPFQIYVRRITEARDEGMSLSVVSVTPGFLEALGARQASGRLFESAEDRFEPSAVLLSESAARLAAPGEDLAGRELPMRLPPVARFAGAPLVAGIVDDVKYLGLDKPAAAAVYLPWSARPTETAWLAVRADGELAALAPALRRILREIDPGLPVPEIRPLEDEMARSIADRRLRVVPALGFAAVALGVALTGIFALFSRAAAERRRELAIRIALGSSRSRILGLMLRSAGALTAAGLAAGLAGAVGVAAGLESLLFGVTPHDPPTFAAVLLFVAAACLLAAWLPARRASRVEPLELLRAE